MAAIGISRVEPFPFHFTVPGQALNLTRNPVAIMIKISTEVGRSQQISILEHVDCHTGGQSTRRCPRVNHSPMCVNEVCALGCHRSEECVILIHTIIAIDEPDCPCGISIGIANRFNRRARGSLCLYGGGNSNW